MYELKCCFQVHLIHVMFFFKPQHNTLSLHLIFWNITLNTMHEILPFPAIKMINPPLFFLSAWFTLQPLQSHCCASLLTEARRRGRPRSSIPRMADRGHGKERWGLKLYLIIKKKISPLLIIKDLQQQQTQQWKHEWRYIVIKRKTISLNQFIKTILLPSDTIKENNTIFPQAEICWSCYFLNQQ